MASDEPQVLRPALQGRIDHAFDFLTVCRLGEPVVGAGIQGQLDPPAVLDRGEDDDRRTAFDVGQGALEQPEAIELRHHHVGQNEVELTLVKAFEGLETVGRLDAAVAQVTQAPHERAAHGGLIVYD